MAAKTFATLVANIRCGSLELETRTNTVAIYFGLARSYWRLHEVLPAQFTNMCIVVVVA